MDPDSLPGPPAAPPAESVYLALDTAGSEASLALGLLSAAEENGPLSLDSGRTVPGGGRSRPGTERIRVLGQKRLEEEEEHASLLVPRIDDLLQEVGAQLRDLAGIVVGAGPGSFTGVRVGAATAKGLAWALGVPLWAFSSLAGAAVAIDDDPLRPRLVLFDARGDRVYAAAYRLGEDGLETVLSPRACTVGEVLDELVPPGACIMGDGALRHGSLFEGFGGALLLPPAGRPSAEGLLRLLALDPGTGPVPDIGRWEPDYLRESGAERLWKRRRDWRGV